LQGINSTPGSIGTDKKNNIAIKIRLPQGENKFLYQVKIISVQYTEDQIFLHAK